MIDTNSQTGITVAEAAELLGLTPQAIRNRGYTVRDAGTRPALLDRDEVAADYAANMSQLESELRRMKGVASRLAISVNDWFAATDQLPGDGVSDLSILLLKLDVVYQEKDDLREQLANERTGRANAESRVDELKKELKRTNEMIDQLLRAIRVAKADPDPNLDGVDEMTAPVPGVENQSQAP